MARMWHHGKKEEGNQEPPWSFKAFKEVDPDLATSIGYEFARMAQKSVTWDFDKQEKYRQQMDEPQVRDEVRQRRTVLLEPVPWRDGWHRVPRGTRPPLLRNRSRCLHPQHHAHPDPGRHQVRRRIASGHAPGQVHRLPQSPHPVPAASRPGEFPPLPATPRPRDLLRQVEAPLRLRRR